MEKRSNGQAETPARKAATQVTWTVTTISKVFSVPQEKGSSRLRGCCLSQTFKSA